MKKEKKNLAKELQSKGIAVGDVIELGHKTDSIDRKISKAIKNKPRVSKGWLVEITAIGQEGILGFVLEGPSRNEGMNYADIDWSRHHGLSESHFSGAAYFRKVGRTAGGSFSWIHPNLVNIYTRCLEAEEK